MKEHPINEILKTSLENIGDMIDVNKVVGEPIILPNNAIAIPISKVVCGYGVGGSQLKNKNYNNENSSELFPFAGATGGGLTMTPFALIIIMENKIKLMKVDKNPDILQKVIETIKDIIK